MNLDIGYIRRSVARAVDNILKIEELDIHQRWLEKGLKRVRFVKRKADMA